MRALVVKAVTGVGTLCCSAYNARIVQAARGWSTPRVLGITVLGGVLTAAAIQILPGFSPHPVTVVKVEYLVPALPNLVEAKHQGEPKATAPSTSEKSVTPVPVATADKKYVDVARIIPLRAWSYAIKAGQKDDVIAVARNKQTEVELTCSIGMRWKMVQNDAGAVTLVMFAMGWEPTSFSIQAKRSDLLWKGVLFNGEEKSSFGSARRAGEMKDVLVAFVDP